MRWRRQPAACYHSDDCSSEADRSSTALRRRRPADAKAAIPVHNGPRAPGVKVSEKADATGRPSQSDESLLSGVTALW